MTVERSKIDSIIKTLPIGYYCGRELKVIVDDESATSFIDLMHDTIHLSIANVTGVLETLQCDDISDDELENYIRDILYHEVSHGILTPNVLLETSDSYSLDKDILNIFEDERIETLLKDYYRDVNFKELVHLLNPDRSVSSAKELFFEIVRFRNAPDDYCKCVFLPRVQKIIDEYGISVINYSYGTDHETGHSYGPIYNYIHDIRYLWDNVEKYYNNNKEKLNNQNSQPNEQNDSDKNQNNQNNNSNGTNNANGSQNFEKSNNQNNSQFNKTDKDQSNADKNLKTEDLSEEEQENIHDSLDESERLKDLVNQGIRNKIIRIGEKVDRTFIDNHFKSELMNIFASISKVHKNNASAVNAYSGVFNPRAVVRNDYKYFVHSNRAGNAKAFSKVHVNLFLDESGSFYNNEVLANQIIKALSDIDKSNPNFSFTLITMGYGERIREENNLLYKAFGENNLDKEIFEIYKKVQDSQAMNCNIVLFDGYAGPEKMSDGRSTFSAFDHDNTIVITDPDNESFLKDCPKAKTCVTYNYIKELKKILISTLRGVIR